MSNLDTVKEKKLKERNRRNALMASNFIPEPFKGPTAMYSIGVGPLVKSEWSHWKERYPTMQLSGCEPNPVLYSQLLQKFPGRLLQTAISDKEYIDLYMEPESEKTFGRSSIFPAKGLSENTLTVPCLTLDEFDVEAGSPKDILLWMDIEGSELIALKSGEKLLKSGRVNTINLEVRDDVRGMEGEWPTADEIEEYLNSVGFIKAMDYNNQKTHWDAIYQRIKK